MKTKSFQRGFTLTEILITMAVMGLLMTAVMSFFIQGARSMYASDQRMKLAAQIKKFSNELVVHATRSNQFVLFKSADLANFNPANADFATNSYPGRQVMVPVVDEKPLLPGGDFAVFVYFEIPKPKDQSYHRIQKLEGYFLTRSSTEGIGPVKKVVIDLGSSPAAYNTTIESILTTNWNSKAVFTTYFPLVRGVALPQVVDGVAADADTLPRLFYMTDVRNVIINGQIFSSNKDINTKDWRTYSNAFCFNITPRT